MVIKLLNILSCVVLKLYDLPCRAVENYNKITQSNSPFDGIAVLKSIGNFFGVFFGAFALGSAMGCVTAIVSFTYERLPSKKMLKLSGYCLSRYSVML